MELLHNNKLKLNLKFRMVQRRKKGTKSPFVPRYGLPVEDFTSHAAHLGRVSRKPRKLFGREKPFVKIRLAYSLELVFSYVVKGIKIRITAKSRASRRLSFKDTKRILSPEMRPKSFGTFEKQAPGLVSCY